MRRLIWLPLAGFLLVAGATIAAAAALPSTPAAAQIGNGSSSPSPSAAATKAPDGQDSWGGPLFEFRSRNGPGAGWDLLDQVLSDLVEAGTITQDQADTITSAFDQAITDKRTQAEHDRQALMAQWQQIQGFLSDGVITQDEVNQLPQDSPLRQVFDSIATDGQVSLDQLRQLRMLAPGLMGPGGAAGLHGDGFGPGAPWHMGRDDGNDHGAESSPTPTTGTSS
jgi:hypothetical protein